MSGRSCGHFDDAHREYVITDPRTPVRWINYIGELSFGGFVDQVGGGVLCRRDPSLGRIVRYDAQRPQSDLNGEGAYLRVRPVLPESATFGSGELFSPFWAPVLAPYESFECRVGLGYTSFRILSGGIEVEVLVFVPRGEPVAIRRYRVTNRRKGAVEVDLIPVVEYSHFDAVKQLTNADWVPQTMQSWAVREQGGLVTLLQGAFMQRGRAENFFTCNLAVSSFESERARFLGDYGYGTWARPRALAAAELANSEARRGDNIGALLLRLGRIEPGAAREASTLLGQAESYDAARPIIERFRDPSEIEDARRALSAFWERYLANLQVHTPDACFDSMINIHNPHQCFVTRSWSRYLSLYQLGFGDRGIGTRDSAQDALGALAFEPDEARGLVELLLAVQLPDGNSMHQVNPLSGVASIGDAAERPDRPRYYGDDHLWVVLAACRYLKETADLAWLGKGIPFYHGGGGHGGGGHGGEVATVDEHLRRALEFSYRNRGKHGLPLLGFADWNDTVNLPTGAESLFNANLFGVVLREYVDVLRFSGRLDETARYESWYGEIRDAVERHAWDGEWYVRYFNADGGALGSKHNDRGKIFANGQSWPVLSGFASIDRAHRALDSVRRHLNTRNGIKLSWPGYDRFDPEVGGITTYPPGAKENGGIFLHANPWVVIAETLAGNGDRAYEYWSQINPATRNERIDEYECEPYVYAQNLLGDEHPQFGLARNSWLTGTASWMLQAAAQYLLGVRAEFDHLVIDPCIPSRWERCSVERVFQGVRYHVIIRNPDHVCQGVRSLIVNGSSFDRELRVPPFSGEAEVSVEVTLGKGGASTARF